MFRAVTACRSKWRPGGVLFKSDEAGNVAIFVGLLSFITFTFMGAAVDMGRWLQSRRVTMDAMEAATLAGLRNYQETGDANEAEQQALLNYQANTQSRGPVKSDTVSFKLEISGDGKDIAMKAQGNAEYQTLFLAVFPDMLNIKTLPMVRKDNTEHPIAKLAVGQNAGTSLEVSMMLDITGSMGSSDSAGKKKIDSLKEAAKKLIDIVIWDDQSKYTSKIALVPFSDAVNLGNSRAALVRNTSAATYSGKNNSNQNDTWKLTPNCVTERIGNDKFTDTSYTTAKVGALYTTSGSCPTPAVLLPLDSDKTALKTAIDGYSANGWTSGHMGTTWAWYTLSPNFNALWGNAKHNARPYADVNALNDKGKPVLNKIAVLMTDGDYNTAYCNGVADKNTGYSNGDKRNCTSPNGTSSAQATALCTAMKAKGITVYTVGFMVSSAAKTLLTNCATSKEHFYDANDGAQLMQAFTAIAYQLVPPYVAH